MFMRISFLSSLFVAAFALSHAAPYAQTPDVEATPNPELVGALSKELGATPQQAAGAAGALFGAAKTRLNPADWSKVAGAVPGIDGLLQAAPPTGGPGGVAGTSGVAGIPGAASLTGTARMADSFTKLGLKPEMVAKAVPVLTNYVSKSGGADVGQLLAGALK
jgi:hypothetical protein